MNNLQKIMPRHLVYFKKLINKTSSKIGIISFFISLIPPIKSLAEFLPIGLFYLSFALFYFSSFELWNESQNEELEINIIDSKLQCFSWTSFFLTSAGIDLNVCLTNNSNKPINISNLSIDLDSTITEITSKGSSRIFDLLVSEVIPQNITILPNTSIHINIQKEIQSNFSDAIQQAKFIAKYPTLSGILKLTEITKNGNLEKEEKIVFSSQKLKDLFSREWESHQQIDALSILNSHKT